MLCTLRTVLRVKARSYYLNVSGLRIHTIPDASLLRYPNPKSPIDVLGKIDPEEQTFRKKFCESVDPSPLYSINQ